MSGDANAGSKASRAKLGALRSVLPYALAYRGRVAGALIALIVASGATLVVPIAVRRMIDFGFSGGNAGLIHAYFIGMIGVVGVLALASGTRYYFVVTLGERVVADLRARPVRPSDPARCGVLRRRKTGEIVSRLSGDTTQLKATFGSSASIALRNFFMFIGAVTMMVVTSPKLSAYVLVDHSRHHPAALRRRARGSRALAPRPGHARRRHRLRRRKPFGGPRHAGLRRRSGDAARFRAAAMGAYEAARPRRSRAPSSPPWRYSSPSPASSSCCGSARRTCSTGRMTGGQLFAVRAVRGAGRGRARRVVGGLERGIGGRRRRRAHRRIAGGRPEIAAPSAPARAADAGARRARVRRRLLRLSRPPRTRC